MLSDVPIAAIIRLSLILIALICAGWVTVWQVRRRLTQPDETSGAGFTLSDLRRLHKSGQMSDVEFERAKAKVVEAARWAAERDQLAAGAKAGGGGDALRAMRPPPDDSEPL
jgi:hypothetical protein